MELAAASLFRAKWSEEIDGNGRRRCSLCAPTSSENSFGALVT